MSERTALEYDPAAPNGHRLSPAIYALALGVFLMGTTEFLIAGLLPAMAADLEVSLAQAGQLITVFAVGMIVGAPMMAVATRRIARRWTLIGALVVFAAGHLVAAFAPSFAVLGAARFITALATGAFWAVAAVVATSLAAPGTSSRAVGVVNAGGMLATVLGVPLGALAGQLFSWRGAFVGLAVLAAATVALIARQVPHQRPPRRPGPIRSELRALRSGRLWLALAGCAGATGGVLAAYSYISPLLTENFAMPASLVPLVLAAFGVGSLLGSLFGGRLGDARPHTTTIIAPAMTVLLLVALMLCSDAPVIATLLITLLGLFGLGANPVLISLAVRYADRAPTLGSALSVAAFNAGTALASWAGGRALETSAGTNGPLMVGALIAALALVPVIALAITQRRRSGAPSSAARS